MTTEIKDDNWKKADVIFENKSFIFFHKDETDHIFARMQKTGDFYEQELLSVLRSLVRPGDWVVDAGANIGNHSIFFAGICGCNVLAFEPNPVAADILRRNIEINRLSDKIEVHEVALGARQGSGEIFSASEHNLGMAAVYIAEGDTGSVKIDLLSNYVGARTISLLKIDAEGMDYDVLTGAEEVLARDGCAVSIEAAKRDDFLKISELLERYDYVVSGSYNYTPTHIFVNERVGDLQKFLARMSRQLSLDYIDRADLREVFNRVRLESINQIGRLSSVLTSYGAAAQKQAERMLVLVEGLHAKVETLDERVQHSSTHVDRADNSLDAITGLLSSSVLVAEADNLRDAALAQEQALLRHDIRALHRYAFGERPDMVPSLGGVAFKSSHVLEKERISAAPPLIPLSAPFLSSSLRRRAGVATTPERLQMFEKAFMSMAHQVDELHVFLNGHETVPPFLSGIGSVATYLSREHDDLGDAGKFRGLLGVQDGYYLSFDDDILYPVDYATKLVEAVGTWGCPAGVHGSLFRRDVGSYYQQEGRYVFHFKDELKRTIPVDVIGTGTFCADLGLTPLVIDFDYRNMADLWVAEHYRKKKIPLICVEREYGWLLPIETEVLSIWDSNHSNRTVQRVIVEEKSRDLAQQPRPKIQSLPRIFIGIKTYNRKDYVRQSIESVIRTLEPGFDYVFAIADDGSEDGTLNYLDDLRLPIDLKVIRNKRRYASGQFNDLIRYGLEAECEYFFLLDDDVVFRKPGWVSAYRNASLESGYDHLCHYNLPHHAQLVRQRGGDAVPAEFRSREYPLSAYGTVEQCMGALITLTPRLIERVGLADETNFFVRGQWHVDFSARACRAGFNEYSRFFDLRDSNEYIELQNTIAQEYKTSIAWGSEEFKRAAAPDEVARRKAIVRMRNRIHSSATSQFLPESAARLAPLHVNDAIDRVLVMNLDRRPDRMALITERLNRAGIRFERFAAVDGKDPQVQTAYDAYVAGIRYPATSIITGGMQYYQGGFSASEQAKFLQTRSKEPAIRSAGAWAYLLGYRKILCRALEEGWKSVLVLDDDCVFHRNFATIFDRAMYELPANWRILHLGMMQYDWELTERYSEHLYMPHGLIVGSHAVAYRREAMPGLLNWIDMMNLPYDVGPLQKESLRHRNMTFVVTPNLAIQDDLSSDINSSDVAPGEVRSQKNKFRWNLEDYHY